MFPIPSTRYRRITHFPFNGRLKSYFHSPNQELVFRQCGPVGDLTPFTWTSACVITERCNGYFSSIRSGSRVGLANVEESLAMLVGASLVESLVAMWGVE